MLVFGCAITIAQQRARTIIKNLRRTPMKGLKKLVLASAIIAASSSAFAMQAMDEESMSAATGQDGLTISLNSTLTGLGITYVDRGGLTSVLPPYTGAYGNDGAIVISPLGITADLSVDIDAGGSVGDGTGNGMLQVKVGTGLAGVQVDLSGTKISVADFDSTSHSSTGAGVATASDIITFGAGASLNIAATANLATIQLGHEDVGGAMIKMNANLGTVTLTGLSINDTGGLANGGSIVLDTITVNNLNAAAAIDVVAGGLQINTAGTTIGEVALEGVHLGTAASASIGDVYITNLNPSTLITVTGH
jgi:hypothetical protein